MHHYLDFEKPISDLEATIHELKKLKAEDESIDISDEITRLETRAREAIVDIYSKLNAWQKTQVARHPQRPHFVDYAAKLFTEFTPLAGDRKFSEDAAIQSGLARFRGQPVVVSPACFTVQPDCSSRAMRPSSFFSICCVSTNHQPVHRAKPTKTMAKGMISPLRLWRTGSAWASVMGAV